MMELTLQPLHLDFLDHVSGFFTAALGQCCAINAD